MPDPALPKTHFTRGHRWLTTVNLLLATAAALGLVAMVNYLAQGHFKRWQWSDSANFKLSPQTQRVLHSLTNDVAVTIFFDPQREEDIYSMVSGLLAEYQNASPHVHVKLLDYERHPGEAIELLEKHHLTGPRERDFVLFESDGGKRSKICYARDLSDYDFNEVLSGRSKIVRRTAFRGEMYFTSDIFDVSNPGDFKAYFLTGHGERDPGDPSGKGPKPPENGYSKLAGILKDEVDCDWQQLALGGTNGIPADCKLLIIASPDLEQARLSTNELAQIQTYLKHDNGRLLALLDTTEGLDPVLAEWGVALGSVRVVDQDKNVRVGESDEFRAYPAKDPVRPIHPIMQPLINEHLMMEMWAPHPIFGSSGASTAPGAPIVTPLVATSTNGIELRPDPPPPTSFVLIAAIEQGVINGHDGTRIVLAGDANFLDDALIDSAAANHYFAELSVNWLLQRPDLVLAGLVPRPIQEYKLSMTASQITHAWWLFLAAMPGSVLFLGGLVWLRRRS